MSDDAKLSNPPPKIDPDAKPPAMRLDWREDGKRESHAPACLMVVALDGDGRVLWIDFKPPEGASLKQTIESAAAAYRFGVRQKAGQQG